MFQFPVVAVFAFAFVKYSVIIVIIIVVVNYINLSQLPYTQLPFFLGKYQKINVYIIQEIQNIFITYLVLIEICCHCCCLDFVSLSSFDLSNSGSDFKPGTEFFCFRHFCQLVTIEFQVWIKFEYLFVRMLLFWIYTSQQIKRGNFQFFLSTLYIVCLDLENDPFHRIENHHVM